MAIFNGDVKLPEGTQNHLFQSDLDGFFLVTQRFVGNHHLGKLGRIIDMNLITGLGKCLILIHFGDSEHHFQVFVEVILLYIYIYIYPTSWVM